MEDQDKIQPENTPDDLDPAAEGDQLEERVENDINDLVAENVELQSKLLRAAADYQNYVRRSQQNVVAAREQQTMALARELISVLDHFDNALSIDMEKATARSVMDGLFIVRDELLKTLERHGVQRVNATKGEEFDPNRHEALMREKAEGIATNHVVNQLQPGYLINDKTLRPVKVSVAE
ncbi:MAG: nucleotide exchange factor GrpE [Phycisphaeraceae bacterium]